MRRPRADRDALLVGAHVGEPVAQVAEVDQERGARESEFHHRHERVAAGKETCFIISFGQELDHLVEVVWCGVGEGCGNQATFYRERQIFSGVIGMSMWLTPCPRSASTMALTVAAGAPVAPLSPQPFSPKGFTGEGVNSSALSTGGSTSQLGSMYSR